MLTIDRVQSKADLQAFLECDLELYRERPLYAPPLRYDLARRIEKWTRPPKEGPRKYEAELFLARRNGEVVGRLAASIDHHKNERAETASGAFGLFECAEDPQASRGLFDRAQQWLVDRRIQRVLGPYGFTQEDPYVGLLVDGFDEEPSFGMTYSLPHYPQLVEEAGFGTAMDLQSYIVPSQAIPPPIAEKGEEILARGDVRIRPIDMGRVWDEAKIIKNVFNTALSDNWEFVPFSDDQVRGMVQELKLLADPRLILIAEVDGQPAGCVINIPDYNDVLRACQGRLFPTGLLRLLWAKRKRSKFRAYALGVLPPYRRLGLATLLVYETFRKGTDANYQTAEVTWILGNNVPMNELARLFARPGGKKHRIYEKSLG